MVTDETEAAAAKTYSLRIQGWYRVARVIVTFLLRLFARIEVQGLGEIPDDGPYLLITNHLHWLDPPILMAIFPYRAYVFAAAKREHHWFFGPLFRSLDAIFVRRGEVDRKALRQALAVVQGGGILGMAPEGTRSDTGAMQQGRSGAAYLAYRANVPLVPVVITGQERAFSALKRLRRGRICATFAPPFGPPVAPAGRVRAKDLRTFTEEIMYRLAAMLPSKYRGEYEDVEDTRPDLVAQYVSLDR